MHFYPFNIGDYKSHTEHLEPLEDIAYRRMIDYCFLHEKGLPKTIDEISRLIRMRTHSDCIATVLKEFFDWDKASKTWINSRVKKEINKYREKSEKARNSAKARWGVNSDDANALRLVSEGNAKQETRNKKQETVNKKQSGFEKPTIESIKKYLQEKNITSVDAEKFFYHYESNGWMRGKNKIKPWKACVNTWRTNNNSNNQTIEKQSYKEL